MSFEQLSNELTGEVGGLSPFLADTYINQAWRDVRNARQWSFLQEDGGIVCPTQATAGTASITQFSQTVTLDADASAAVLAFDPIPGLTNMQIRFGGQGGAAQVGQVYCIDSFDQAVPTAVVLTLNRMVVQATNATSGYQCYRCYITPPVDDFLSWQSFVDMTNGWRLKQDYSSTYFDFRDPQRQAQGLAYYLGNYKGNPETQPRPRYELWPHPTSGQTFYGRYRRQGEDLINAADVLPIIIPDQLVLLRARGWYAYPWAAANVGRFPKLRGVGWVAMTLDAKKMYAEALITAKRQDDEQALTTVYSRGHGLRRNVGGLRGMWDIVIDSNWLQSHLVNF